MKRAAKPAPPPELSIYRGKTIRLLRRYFNMSVELGRLPSIMGRELLPSSKVTCHPVSFEGFVVFVLDIERCLQRLRRIDQQLITRVVLQEYTQEDAARMLGWPVIKVERRLPEVLDVLSDILLRTGLMRAFPDPHSEEVDDDAVAKRASVIDSLHAAAEETAGRVAWPHERRPDDFRQVPVEIFLSSPPDVTNRANCMTP